MWKNIGWVAFIVAMVALAWYTADRCKETGGHIIFIGKTAMCER